jgi:hypothetical protein
VALREQAHAYCTVHGTPVTPCVEPGAASAWRCVKQGIVENGAIIFENVADGRANDKRGREGESRRLFAGLS